MEIRQLKSFVSVAECKSFSRAAQLLYVSQPSISTHIMALEQEFGVKLIERTSKSLSLTKAGEEFYEDAVNILKINDRMVNSIGRERRSLINIGASTIPSTYLLPDIIANYRKKNSDCTFYVTMSDSRKVLDGVLEGIYDVGFVGMESHEKGIESRAIASDKPVFILPDNEYYRKLAQNDEAIKTILSEPIIIREDGSGSGEMLKKLMTEYDFAEKDLNVIAAVNDLESIIGMVERGIGVSCVSSLAVSDIRHRNIICLSRFTNDFERKFYIVYKKGILKKEPVGSFIYEV